MSGLGTGVLYLVLIAIELLLPGTELELDYLQDGTPVARLEVTELPSSDRDLFLVRALIAAPEDSGTGSGESEELLYRIEQSDIDSSNYLLYVPGESVPEVVSLAPALRAFPAVIPDGEYVLQLTSEDGSTGENGDRGGPSGSLFVLPRPPYLVLTLPESGILLIVEPNP